MVRHTLSYMGCHSHGVVSVDPPGVMRVNASLTTLFSPHLRHHRVALATPEPLICDTRQIHLVCADHGVGWDGVEWGWVGQGWVGWGPPVGWQ